MTDSSKNNLSNFSEISKYSAEDFKMCTTKVRVHLEDLE